MKRSFIAAGGVWGNFPSIYNKLHTSDYFYAHGRENNLKDREKDMLILTEKPSVAEQFAMALGGFKKSKEGWWTNGRNDCIVGAQGHLLSLLMPEEYDEKYKKWNLEDLPIIPDMRYNVTDKSRAAFKRVKDALAKYPTDDLILATDADREGELIGGLILRHLDFKNWHTARRFWVSEALEPAVVKKGITDAKPLLDTRYQKLYRKAFARQHSDWLVGINITRLLTGHVHQKLTFGRVQTAVLAAVCHRDAEIADFISHPFYQLECLAETASGPEIRMLLEGLHGDRFEDRTQVQSLSEKLQRKTLTVIEVKEEDRKEEPPLLFSLTSLQKYCAVNYGLSPADTLAAAQKLYEDFKCMSYPRTASQYMGDDNAELLREKYSLLADIYPRQAKGSSLKAVELKSRRLLNSKKVEGHHALIPLAPLPPDSPQDVTAVYNAVLQRFFDTLKEPYIYKAVTINAEGEGQRLTAHGRTVLQQGWKTNSIKDADTAEEDMTEEQSLPSLRKGENLTIIDTKILDKKTQPPRHYTDATILAMMENPKDETTDAKLVGLGTPATRAGILDELIKNQYIVRSGKKLISTELGRFLIQTVESIPALAPYIELQNTTRWEELLDTDPDGFLNDIKDFVRTAVKNRIEAKWDKAQKETLGDCPVCKEKILEGKKGYYCSGYKGGCKFIIWKVISGASITAADVKNLLSGKQTRPKKMLSKNGKEFTANLSLDSGTGKIIFNFSKK